MAHKATIYVVEGDYAVRDSVRVLLECEGYEVADFASCADFLGNRRLGADSKCVLLSAEMPEMSMPELLRRVQEQGNSMPAILMTEPNALFARSTRSARTMQVLEKPFAGSELLASIERALRGNRVD